MRLHRFFVSKKFDSDTTLTIDSAELVHQVRRVFRLKKDDQIIIFNGTGFDHVCKIDSFGDRSTIVSNNSIINLIVTATVPSRFIPRRMIYLAASIIKKDYFELVVEKAVELGVTDIIPIQSDRSEKKSINVKRLEKIVVEASEQSGRGDIPMIHKIMGVLEADAFLAGREVKNFAFHTEGDAISRSDLRYLPAGRQVSKPIGVFIGPEGGWSPNEIETFHKKNIPLYCLGPQILRAETATIAALSQFVFRNI